MAGINRGDPQFWGATMPSRPQPTNKLAGLSNLFGIARDQSAFRATRDTMLLQAEARFRQFPYEESQQMADLVRDNPMAAKMLGDEMYGEGKGLEGLENHFRERTIAEKRRQAALAQVQGGKRTNPSAPKALEGMLQMLEPNAEQGYYDPDAVGFATKTVSSLESGESSDLEQAQKKGRGPLTPAQQLHDRRVKQNWTLLQDQVYQGSGTPDRPERWNRAELVEILGHGSQGLLSGISDDPEAGKKRQLWDYYTQFRLPMHDETNEQYSARMEDMLGVRGLPIPRRPDGSVDDAIMVSGEVYELPGEPYPVVWLNEEDAPPPKKPGDPGGAGFYDPREVL